MTTTTSATGDEQHETTARVSGRQRSGSEHSVSMKTSVQPNKPPVPKFQPSKLVAGHRGGHVWTPPQAKLQPASAAGYSGVANGPLKGRTATGGTSSLAERHTRRRIENKHRKATGYRLGIDY